MKRNIQLSLEEAEKLYSISSGDMKALLITAFPELTPYPASYKQLQNMISNSHRVVYTINSELNVYEVAKVEQSSTRARQIILSEEKAKERIAFLQVLTLRDYYNSIDDFEPNWRTGPKFIIYNDYEILNKDTVCYAHHVLAFKSAETRNLFYNNFKDLLEQCKDLI